MPHINLKVRVTIDM